MVLLCSLIWRPLLSDFVGTGNRSTCIVCHSWLCVLLWGRGELEQNQLGCVASSVWVVGVYVMWCKLPLLQPGSFLVPVTLLVAVRPASVTCLAVTAAGCAAAGELVVAWRFTSC